MVNYQNRSIFYLAIAAVGMILLAVSLPGLQFQPGQPIPGAVDSFVQNQPSGTAAEAPTAPLLWVLQSTFALGFITLLVLFIVGLIRKMNIRRMAKIAAGLAGLFALFILLPKIIPAKPGLTPGDGAVHSPPAAVYSIAPIGNPPANLYWIVIAGLMLCVIGIGAWLLRQALRKPADPDGLAQAAGETLRAIQGGQDLGNAIIACYLRMIDVIKEERGLEREETVTPREFQELLAEKGMPEVPVRMLTRLFERERYGRASLGPGDAQAAVDCLTAILVACRGMKDGEA